MERLFLRQVQWVGMPLASVDLATVGWVRATSVTMISRTLRFHDGITQHQSRGPARGAETQRSADDIVPESRGCWLSVIVSRELTTGAPGTWHVRLPRCAVSSSPVVQE